MEFGLFQTLNRGFFFSSNFLKKEKEGSHKNSFPKSKITDTKKSTKLTKDNEGMVPKAVT